MDPMAEKIKELELLQKRIQTEVDRRSKKMEREMTARFAIDERKDNNSTDEDEERGGGGRRGGRGKKSPASSSKSRRPRGGRDAGDEESDDDGEAASAGGVGVKVRGGSTAPEYVPDAERGAARHGGSGRKNGRRGAVDSESESGDDAAAWRPGALFPEAVRKEKTLRHVYKRWQLANDKLDFYADEVEAGTFTEADVLQGCGYGSASEYDAVTVVMRFALKNKSKSSEVAEVLRGMRSRSLEDLREACEGAGMKVGRRGRGRAAAAAAPRGGAAAELDV